MDLMQMLQSQLKGGALQQISQQIGASENQTAVAANGIFTALLGGLAQNSSNPGGLASLASALDRDHDGSILDDLAGLVGSLAQGQVPSNAANGMGILGHVLGDKQQAVAQQVGAKSGLDMSQIMKLMPILAPIVMAVLGKMKSGSSSGTGMDVPDLAQILMGSAQSAQGGAFGDLIGSVLGNVLGGQQPTAPAPTQSQGGGLFGKLLGTIFKR